MKIKAFLIILVIGFVGKHYAQSPENLSRVVLATVPENETVEYGQFQVDLQKALAYKEGQDEYFWFSFAYVTQNKYNNNQNIYFNGRQLFTGRHLQIRMYRMGPSEKDCIFVIKSLDADAPDIGFHMEQTRAFGLPYQVCDAVVDINDDGFVFRQNGKYKYCKYKVDAADVSQLSSVVWLDSKNYVGSTLGMPAEKKLFFSYLPTGAVYHESENGHYYFIHHDDYMPYSVLVVDNKVYELFDVFEEEAFRLKFSHDGKHWMAVGNDRYWIDGEMKSVEGFEIVDFVISNDGHYGYTACAKGSESNNCMVVADGQILRMNARVCYFALDDAGKLKARFTSGDRFLEYENGTVTDVTEKLSSVYYPDNSFYEQEMVVQSEDGAHRLTYKKGMPGVKIDGVRVTTSVPCFAIYDKRSHTFVWNAIETVGEKQELVLYRYVVKRGFFK